MDQKRLIALLSKEAGEERVKELANVHPNELLQLFLDEQRRIDHSFEVKWLTVKSSLYGTALVLLTPMLILVAMIVKYDFKNLLKKLDRIMIENKDSDSRFYRKVCRGTEIQNAILRIAAESSAASMQAILSFGIWNQDEVVRRLCIDRLTVILPSIQATPHLFFHEDHMDSMIKYLSSLEHSDDECKLMLEMIEYFIRIRYRPVYGSLKHLVSITAKTENQQKVQDRALKFIESYRPFSSSKF